MKSTDDKRLDQLLHELAVDVVVDLVETSRMEEAAAGDTSDMLTECQLGICEHTEVTHDGRRHDDVACNGHVEIDANELL